LTRRLKAWLKDILPANVGPVIRRVAYYGRGFLCPLCGASVRKLLPGGKDFAVLRELDVVGAGRREQDVCPVCRSKSRSRLVGCYLALEGGLADKPTHVLHVAPERGLSEWLRHLKSIDYVAADLVPELYEYAAPIALDITKIPLRDAVFDLVICNHVLEHVSDDAQAMREIHRVLKPGGRAILQVPFSLRLSATLEDSTIIDPRERERLFGQRDHVRLYGPDYPERLRKAGFSVDVLDPVERWGRKTAEGWHLDVRERLFVASRPVAQLP